MAEQAPAVQNKGMLIVAVVLGLAATILVNWEVSSVRTQLEGEKVTVLQFARDMKMGEKIDAKDLTAKEMPRKWAEGLGDIATVPSPDLVASQLEVFRNQVLNRNVFKGNFFSTSMTTTSDYKPPSTLLKDADHVAMVVPLRESLGNTLRPEDRVNLVARIPMKDGRVRPERIIEDVFVLGIGGKGLSPSGSGGAGGDEGSTSYRTITIEVTKQASLQLEQILVYVGSGVRVELLKPDSTRSPQAGIVKAGVIEQLESSGPPVRGGGAPIAPPPS
jgi:hypothetical protein